MDAQGTRGPWSASRRFNVQPPTRVFTVPAGATHRQVLDLLAQASGTTPATLRFTAGNYRLALEADSLFPGHHIGDLVIDGNGATRPIDKLRAQSRRGAGSRSH